MSDLTLNRRLLRETEIPSIPTSAQDFLSRPLQGKGEIQSHIEKIAAVDLINGETKDACQKYISKLLKKSEDAGFDDLYDLPPSLPSGAGSSSFGCSPLLVGGPIRPHPAAAAADISHLLKQASKHAGQSLLNKLRPPEVEENVDPEMVQAELARQRAGNKRVYPPKSSVSKKPPTQASPKAAPAKAKSKKQLLAEQRKRDLAVASEIEKTKAAVKAKNAVVAGSLQQDAVAAEVALPTPPSPPSALGSAAATTATTACQADAGACAVLDVGAPATVTSHDCDDAAAADTTSQADLSDNADDVTTMTSGFAEQQALNAGQMTRTRHKHMLAEAPQLAADKCELQLSKKEKRREKKDQRRNVHLECKRRQQEKSAAECDREGKCLTACGGDVTSACDDDVTSDSGGGHAAVASVAAYESLDAGDGVERVVPESADEQSSAAVLETVHAGSEAWPTSSLACSTAVSADTGTSDLVAAGDGARAGALLDGMVPPSDVAAAMATAVAAVSTNASGYDGHGDMARLSAMVDAVALQQRRQQTSSSSRILQSSSADSFQASASDGRMSSSSSQLSTTSRCSYSPVDFPPSGLGNTSASGYKFCGEPHVIPSNEEQFQSDLPPRFQQQQQQQQQFGRSPRSRSPYHSSEESVSHGELDATTSTNSQSGATNSESGTQQRSNMSRPSNPIDIAGGCATGGKRPQRKRKKSRKAKLPTEPDGRHDEDDDDTDVCTSDSQQPSSCARSASSRFAVRSTDSGFQSEGMRALVAARTRDEELERRLSTASYCPPTETGGVLAVGFHARSSSWAGSTAQAVDSSSSRVLGAAMSPGELPGRSVSSEPSFSSTQLATSALASSTSPPSSRPRQQEQGNTWTGCPGDRGVGFAESSNSPGRLQLDVAMDTMQGVSQRELLVNLNQRFRCHGSGSSPRSESPRLPGTADQTPTEPMSSSSIAARINLAVGSARTSGMATSSSPTTTAGCGAQTPAQVMAVATSSVMSAWPTSSAMIAATLPLQLGATTTACCSSEARPSLKQYSPAIALISGESVGMTASSSSSSSSSSSTEVTPTLDAAAVVSENCAVDTAGIAISNGPDAGPFTTTTATAGAAGGRTMVLTRVLHFNFVRNKYLKQRQMALVRSEAVCRQFPVMRGPLADVQRLATAGDPVGDDGDDDDDSAVKGAGSRACAAKFFLRSQEEVRVSAMHADVAHRYLLQAAAALDMEPGVAVSTAVLEVGSRYQQQQQQQQHSAQAAGTASDKPVAHRCKPQVATDTGLTSSTALPWCSTQRAVPSAPIPGPTPDCGVLSQSAIGHASAGFTRPPPGFQTRLTATTVATTTMAMSAVTKPTPAATGAPATNARAASKRSALTASSTADTYDFESLWDLSGKSIWSTNSGNGSGVASISNSKSNDNASNDYFDDNHSHAFSDGNTRTSPAASEGRSLLKDLWTTESHNAGNSNHLLPPASALSRLSASAAPFVMPTPSWTATSSLAAQRPMCPLHGSVYEHGNCSRCRAGVPAASAGHRVQSAACRAGASASPPMMWLLIRQIPVEMEEGSLRMLCQHHGTIHNFFVDRYRGEALIRFANSADATAACSNMQQRQPAPDDQRHMQAGSELHGVLQAVLVHDHDIGSWMQHSASASASSSLLPDARSAMNAAQGHEWSHDAVGSHQGAARCRGEEHRRHDDLVFSSGEYLNADEVDYDSSFVERPVAEHPSTAIDACLYGDFGNVQCFTSDVSASPPDNGMLEVARPLAAEMRGEYALTRHDRRRQRRQLLPCRDVAEQEQQQRPQQQQSHRQRQKQRQKQKQLHPEPCPAVFEQLQRQQHQQHGPKTSAGASPLTPCTGQTRSSGRRKQKETAPTSSSTGSHCAQAQTWDRLARSSDTGCGIASGRRLASSSSLLASAIAGDPAAAKPNSVLVVPCVAGENSVMSELSSAAKKNKKKNQRRSRSSRKRTRCGSPSPFDDGDAAAAAAADSPAPGRSFLPTAE